MRQGRLLVAVYHKLDVATAEADVFEFTVGELREGLAGDAGIVPSGEGFGCGGEEEGDTGRKSCAVCNAGGFVESHFSGP